METTMEQLMQQNLDLQEKMATVLQEIATARQQTVPKGVPGLHFDKYDETAESFDDYIDRLTAYFEVQNVPDTKKVKTLITVISPKLFTLLKNLIYPNTYDTKTFEELKDILKKHLNPKPLIIPSRHAFLNRKQLEGETVSSYIAELRRLAVPCNYSGDMLNVMLRDVFVSGLQNRFILDRLFEEDDTPLENTIKLALAMEKASLGANEILQNAQPASVHKVNTRNPNKYKSKPKSDTKPEEQHRKNFTCLKCGKSGHKATTCFATNLNCTFCHKTGHVAKVCFKRKTNTQTGQVHQLNSISDNNSESETETILNLNKINIEPTIHHPPIMLAIKINGKPVEMELDTGSAVTVLNNNVYRNLSSNKLEPTTILLKNYNNQIIKPLGKAMVKVEYEGQHKNLELYVVKEKLTTILGRSWLANLKLNWTLIKQIQVQTRDDSPVELLQKYNKIFSEDIGPVNHTATLQLKNGAQPRFKKARTIPFSLQNRIEDELKRLQESDIIEHVDTSEWATPIVPIVKANGTIRICADYSQTVNPQLHVPQHPLPKFEEIFAKLGKGQHFTTLDVRSAFMHVPVDEESAKILTINTHKGLFRVKRLMYGVSSAPAIWQRYIEQVLNNIEGICVVHDDIIITGENNEQHLHRLQEVFHRLHTQGIKLNRSKCRFFQKEVCYLGYKVDAKGIHKTDEKINAVLRFERPTNVKQVKSFMGLITFYGKFCKDLATTAHPLYNLTKNNTKFKWTEECEASFQKLKKEISSHKILTHYNPELPLVLAVDASPVGLGSVLSHQMPNGEERPIAFASRVLSKSECNYSQIDKEALAIKWGVQKFFHYVYGRKFTLITDHQPLIHIFGNRKKLPVLSATRLLHYALYLQIFQFDIKYRKSNLHGNADCLSRFPTDSENLNMQDEVTIFHLNQVESLPVTAENLATAIQSDAESRKLFEDIRDGKLTKTREGMFSLENGCIFYGSRVYIPKKYRKNILQELHLGHIGIVKMKGLARSYVYWENINQDIENLARSCHECIMQQKEPRKTNVHFWEYPTQPWDRIHVDFAGPFMNHMFLVIIDAHSKWPEISIVKNINANTTINELRKTFARWGIPRTLVSDNGATFTSYEFQKFMRECGIKHITGAPFHASSNGQAERYVDTMKRSLKCIQEFTGSMQEKLDTFLFSYRRAPNITTGESPAKLFLKRELRSRLDQVRPDVEKKVHNNTRKSLLQFVDRNFSEGEKVAITNYNNPNKKWLIGTIINKDGQLNYTVESNGQLYRRHTDQIRTVSQDIQLRPPPLLPRFAKFYSDRQVPDSEPSSSTPTPEEQIPEQEPLPNISDPPAEITEPVPAPTNLRRSTRIRKPPSRLNW